MAQDLSGEAPRLRLRRWPPASVVRGSTERVRMATLLARRALNAHDLHRLTGLDATECLVFMKLLRASNLLVPPPVTEQERKSEDEKSTTALQKNTGLHHGLARRLARGLRKRLGLGS